MVEKNKVSLEVNGGNNDVGIGCNSHRVVNEKGDDKTSVVIDMGMKMGGEFNEIPDIRQELAEADALVFTHCHADHIQGLIDFVKMGYDFTKEVRNEKTGAFEKKPVPLIGSAFTISYIKGELARNKIPSRIIDNIFTVVSDADNHNINVPEEIADKFSYQYKEGSDGKERLTVSIGKEGTKIDLSLIDMDHSAKGSNAVGIEMQTEYGAERILHLGDWKEEAEGHAITDYVGLSDFMEKGVNAVMMDSTSTVKPKTTFFEKDVRKSIEELVVESFSDIQNKAKKEGENPDEAIKGRFDIVHSSIARSGNRIFDCDILGSVEALRKMGRIKEGETIDVYMHGGADFTRKVLEEAAKISSSSQYNILDKYTKETGIKFNFLSGRDIKKYGITSTNDAIHVTTGTQADEQAQLKKVSMPETRTDSTLPTGSNVIYIETQTPIPSGNNVENVNIMNDGLKEVFEIFKTGVHSSGHASKEASDKMIKMLMAHNPNKEAVVLPIHGAFAQGHLEATVKGLDEMGIKSAIVRNGYKMTFEKGEIKYEKTKEKGTILVIEGGVSEMNDKNPWGNDINDAAKKGSVAKYNAYETEKSFGGKSYVLLESNGDMSVVFECGDVYKEGEKVDRLNLKEKKTKQQNDKRTGRYGDNKQRDENNSHKEYNDARDRQNDREGSKKSKKKNKQIHYTREDNYTTSYEGDNVRNKKKGKKNNKGNNNQYKKNGGKGY